MREKKFFIFAVASLIGSSMLFADGKAGRPDKSWTAGEWQRYRLERQQLRNVLSWEDEKMGVHDGNLIRTIFFNFGSIGAPHREPSMEWPLGSEHGYAYEMGPLVGAEVVDADGITRHIISEGLDDGGDTTPDGYRWGWEPLPGYANPDTNSVAMSDKPWSWPPEWPAWPGAFGEGVIVADQESYWVMDDYYNHEFNFFPDSTDSSRGGLGVEVSCRGYQFDEEAYQDILYFTYEIKNVGTTDHQQMVVGFYGDPHPGGENDYNDDDMAFDLDRNLFYTWDHDNIGDWGPGVGYLGMILTESPGNPADGIDNDGDGLIDESRYDGIDNDGDWDPAEDDVGADGIPNTGDAGEGDGIPTPGEPNFDATDLEESDQLGLTSADASLYHSYYPFQDETVWNELQPGHFQMGAQNADNVFLFGSGYFPLPVGGVERFAVAIVMGEDLNDLLWNVLYARRKYIELHGSPLPEVELTSPNGGETLNGNVEVTWAASGWGGPLRIDIHYSPDRGEHWFLLADSLENDGSFNWNTLDFDDGIYYSLFLVARNESGVNFDFSDSLFTIDNPGNGAPQVFLLSPNGSEIWSGTQDITWIAGDADGDAISLDFYYSVDEGYFWYLITSGEENDGLYPWNTATFPNSANYLIKAIISDGSLSGEDQSAGIFQVYNEHLAMPDSLLVHLAGHGDGLIVVNVVYESALVGHDYEITFDDTTDTVKTYDVYDLNTQQFVVENATELWGLAEGPIFDGIRLWISDILEPFVNDSLTGWVQGDCNYEMEVGLWITGIPHPANYEFQFQGTIGDSVREDARPTVHTHAPFILWNSTECRESRFVIIDNDQNGYWNSGDKVVILTDTVGYAACWWVVFTAPPDSVDPEAGDLALVYINKPFSSNDVFRLFISQVVGIGEGDKDVAVPAKFSLSPNYPNPFNPNTTIEYFLPMSGKVILRVFNVMGQEVVTLTDGFRKPGSYRVFWDGRNSGGNAVASGVYFYRLDDGNFSQTKKMLLLR